MLQQRWIVIFLSVLLVNLVNGQGPQENCRNGMITIPDPQWRPIPSRFEIMTELISGNEMLELSQAFSLTRDAIITSTTRGEIKFYWNYATGETFQVLPVVINQQPTLKCFREVVDISSQTSVISPNTLYVKPSILLGYDARNQPNPNWGIIHVGETELRGIPAVKFISCFEVPDISATVSATYYVSNVNKFIAYLPVNESLILQIDVDVRNRNGRSELFSYNVFRFVPNPSRREERQALETPAGVYCPNRTSTKNIPNDIPERSSSNSETAAVTSNNSIVSVHGLYDTEFRLTRFDFWYPDPFGGPNWLHYSEIHDFATGLNYQYNYTNRQCSLQMLSPSIGDSIAVDGKPTLAQMATPQHLFALDDMNYQYTGEKQCRDHVMCDVWIGENILTNTSVQHREWYWASRMNDADVTEPYPVKMIMKNYENDVITTWLEIFLYNFNRQPYTFFEIDSTLADCYRALGPAEKFNLAVLSFTITNDKKYPVLENLNFFRFHVYETLIFTLFVRPIRISGVIVDKDGDNILVTFTLLDVPPRYGPVEMPLQEAPLSTLIQRLDSVIDSNALVFRARYGAKETVLRAKSGSLNIQHSSTEERPKKSGGKITGLWIGLIVVGIVVGSISAFFAFAQLSK